MIYFGHRAPAGKRCDCDEMESGSWWLLLLPGLLLNLVGSSRSGGVVEKSVSISLFLFLVQLPWKLVGDGLDGS
jgi:hypothetical protein